MTFSPHMVKSSDAVPAIDMALYLIIERSLLFDAKHYLSAYPEVAEAMGDPLTHYFQFGANRGYEPNELFDTVYYRGQCPEIKVTGVNPLVHYLTIGMFQGKEINSLFDTPFYLDLYPHVRESELSAVAHYLTQGVEAGCNPSPGFNTLFYLEKNPDVAAARLNPLSHFLRHGASEGRDPSPDFHTTFYLEQNPDVRNARLNPLEHYLRFGVFEGRAPLETNEEFAQAIDSISSYYLMAREIEPLLPPLQELTEAHKNYLPHSSRMGKVYFDMVKRLDTPFTHLIIVPGLRLGQPEQQALKYVRANLERLGAASFLVICSDGTDRSVVNAFPTGVRVICLSEFDIDLGIDSRVLLVTRLSLQAGLSAFCNFDSGIGWLAIGQFHRQLRTRCRRLYSCLTKVAADSDGIPAGNMVYFFNSCIDHLDAVLVDDENFREALCQRFQLEQINRQKLLVPGLGSDGWTLLEGSST